MVEAPLQAPLRAPTYIRLLARIAATAPLPAGAPPAQRLGEWIDWGRAVALSRALDAAPAEPETTSGAGDEADECARARADLVEAINGGPTSPSPADAAASQQFFRAMQRAMQTETGRLRGQLRDRLAQRSPAHARLAEVDAVMEAVLSPREHALLASVPTLLDRHHARLRETAADGGGPETTPDWHDVFMRDLRQALLAELDLRFQPIDGLLAALGPP